MVQLVIHEGGCDVTGSLDDVHVPVTIVWTAGSILIDLSNHTNVTLEVCDVSDPSTLEIDLDHPYLPREYKNLDLYDGKLIGKFERKIKVRNMLCMSPDIQISDCDLFVNYFSYTKIVHMDIYQLERLPMTVRYLSTPHGLGVSFFGQVLDSFPYLRACTVCVYNNDNYYTFCRVVKENIHRLDKSIVQSTRFVLLYTPVPKSVQTVKQWFTNYTLALCFYKVSQNKHGLFHVLSILIRNRYIQEDETITPAIFANRPDYNERCLHI
jgi:hypothetical protein